MQRSPLPHDVSAAAGSSESISSVCSWQSLGPLTLLRGAGHVQVAVEAGVEPEAALGHGELLQEAVESEGAGPVQPDEGQVAVHREGGHVLGG